jgi:hypothetical protein
MAGLEDSTRPYGYCRIARGHLQSTVRANGADHGSRLMRYKLGRYLQVLGMILLPIGMAGNLALPDQFGPTSVLAMLIVGSCIFTAGYFLQRGAKPR